MKSTRVLKVIPVVLLLALLGLALRAEEMVTIPKSRLQELEDKAAELEKLKGNLAKAKGENIQLRKQHEADAVKITASQAAPPVAIHVSPPLSSLPPLTAGVVVAATDLANHYRADAAAADQRYGKRTFQVQGEVDRFEKPLFTRDYKILLKTADRQTQVICDVFPPEQYGAVFTVNNGSELVGLLAGETRVPIARVGSTVVIEGRCKGLSGSTVKMTGCEFKSAR